MSGRIGAILFFCLIHPLANIFSLFFTLAPFRCFFCGHLLHLVHENNERKKLTRIMNMKKQNDQGSARSHTTSELEGEIVIGSFGMSENRAFPQQQHQQKQ